MGVIINGQERKSVAEQVEENSRKRPRFIRNSTLTLYKKDLPCFVRVMMNRGEGTVPIYIKGGDGSTLTTISTDRTIKDFIISTYQSNKAEVLVVEGTSYTKNTSYYGQDDKALYIDQVFWYGMVIPLSW